MTPDTEPATRLTGRSNPRSGLDYVILLRGAAQNGLRVAIRYVPDKLLLDSGVFAAYLVALAPADTAAPEVLALAVLDDVNNDIVPRWVQIAVETAGDAGTAHAVIVEDRQPNWGNSEILANLPPL